jgi:CPA1 family monovalent cation:H+ antiporter
MTFFESLIALLALAVLLLQVSRRLSIPYPAMLAAAGVALALIPGAPKITLDPRTALALFVAPVLVDSAFDFPFGAVKRWWRPLFALAVVAVLLSAAAVAWLGVMYAGLPLYAALALGAIVAPPDAAAATAVLSAVSMPRGSVTVLKGESLLNDATALLLFSAAVAMQERGGIDGPLAMQLGIAAPGGILLGWLLAKVFRHIVPFVSGTLGGNLLEFVTCFGVWIIAEHLHLSPILCLVAFAMTIAPFAALSTLPRMRIHSFAVWDTAVFLLNVLAFLLMGLQARTIIESMSPERLRDAAQFAGLVVVTLIVVRMAWVLLYNLLSRTFVVVRGDIRPASVRGVVLVGWAGMRGLVTLATAFALPVSFPQRDLIVLTAFAVVLATLIVQGLTLVPLIRLLKLNGFDDGSDAELSAARISLAEAGLAALDGKSGAVADHWRRSLDMTRAAVSPDGDASALDAKRELGLSVLRAQRLKLQDLRKEQRVSSEAYIVLQEELDFQEVSLTTEDERHVEQS